jgi:prevent-host-death family protein
MESVGIRELRQNASALLDRVQTSGITIEITNHGQPVARLVPVPRQLQSSYAELLAAGAIKPGRGNILEVDPVDAPPGTPSSAELLSADRDDR